MPAFMVDLTYLKPDGSRVTWRQHVIAFTSGDAAAAAGDFVRSGGATGIDPATDVQTDVHVHRMNTHRTQRSYRPPQGVA